MCQTDTQIIRDILDMWWQLTIILTHNNIESMNYFSIQDCYGETFSDNIGSHNIGKFTQPCHSKWAFVQNTATMLTNVTYW